MKLLTKEWVTKAERDWLSAGTVFRSRKAPNYDLTCFLSQQTAEKYLKACLQELSIPFKKTHDLVVLVEDLVPKYPAFSLLLPAARVLKEYAVEFRYPGKTANRELARAAMLQCGLIREAVRGELGVREPRAVPGRKLRKRPGIQRRGGRSRKPK